MSRYQKATPVNSGFQWCTECGAVVIDTNVHDLFHYVFDDAARRAYQASRS